MNSRYRTVGVYSTKVTCDNRERRPRKSEVSIELGVTTRGVKGKVREHRLSFTTCIGHMLVKMFGTS